MFCTPEKRYNSLRQKIESKIQTDKKKPNIKDNQFSKQHNSIINPRANFPIQNKYTKETIKEESEEHKITCGQYPEQILTQAPQIITEQIILEFQSLQNKNFYGYLEWIQLNRKFFSHLNLNTARTLWKVLRIINYGDALIPSGLVFQVTRVLERGRTNQKVSLKQLLNQFLEFNNTSNQVNNFRQLKMYPSLQQIQKSYQKQNVQYMAERSMLQIQRGMLHNQRSILQKQIGAYSSSKKQACNPRVFQRIYEDSKVRIETKQSNMYKSVLQNHRVDVQCVFKPKINEYQSQRPFDNQTIKAQRICHSKWKWKTLRQEQDGVNLSCKFKAGQLNRTILGVKNMEEIPGVRSYINRQKYSQASKRKIERFLQRPNSVFPHS